MARVPLKRLFDLLMTKGRSRRIALNRTRSFTTPHASLLMVNLLNLSAWNCFKLALWALCYFLAIRASTIIKYGGRQAGKIDDSWNLSIDRRVSYCAKRYWATITKSPPSPNNTNAQITMVAATSSVQLPKGPVPTYTLPNLYSKKKICLTYRNFII